MAEEIARTHHERWDGEGYPAGLAGEAIPLVGRICAVCDVFDALLSDRPYKEPWPVPEVVHAVDRLDALGADAQGRGPHQLRRAVEEVDDARALLILNPSEELLLEALAYRLARALRPA